MGLAERNADLAAWQRKAVERIKAKGKAGCLFQSHHLPPAEILQIKDELDECRTADEVRSVFTTYRSYPPAPAPPPSHTRLAGYDDGVPLITRRAAPEPREDPEAVQRAATIERGQQLARSVETRIEAVRQCIFTCWGPYDGAAIWERMQRTVLPITIAAHRVADGIRRLADGGAYDDLDHQQRVLEQRLKELERDQHRHEPPGLRQCQGLERTFAANAGVDDEAGAIQREYAAAKRNAEQAEQGSEARRHHVGEMIRHRSEAARMGIHLDG